MISQLKKTIAFLGVFQKIKKNESEQDIMTPYATGFFIDVNGYMHLVTAKHVVFDFKRSQIKDENLHIFTLSKENGKLYFEKLSTIKHKLNVDWIFHENKDVDIGIIPFGFDPQKADILKIPSKFFSKLMTYSNLMRCFSCLINPV